MKFGDRVCEIIPLMSEGREGTLADNGTPEKTGDVRFLVRWDGCLNLYGCRLSNIRGVEDE